MHRVLTGYSQYYNRRYNKSGHLLQGGYKAIVCETDQYLAELGATYTSIRCGRGWCAGLRITLIGVTVNISGYQRRGLRTLIRCCVASVERGSWLGRYTPSS